MLTEAPAQASSENHAVTESLRERGDMNWAPITAITFIAALMRLYGLNSKSVWFDETMSAEIARLPWSQFALAIWNFEANMAPYYVLLHFWSALGGSTAFIRALSVVISTATIPAIYLLGTRLFGRKAGLISAWLLAVNAYHIRYAQEARSYALLVLLATLATWLFVRNLRSPTQAHWGTYTALSVLTVYTHFFGGLVILSHAISLLFMERVNLPWHALRRSLFYFCVGMVPLGVFLAHAGPYMLNWVPRTTPSDVLGFFEAMAGNYGLRLLALDGIAACAAGFAAWRLSRRAAAIVPAWSYGLVISFLLVPLAVILAVSMVHPLFVARYLNPCTIALILIVAAGISAIPSVAIASALLGLISVGSFLGTVSYYRQDFDLLREPWEQATSFVFENAQPGDGVFFYRNFVRVPFEFYRSQRKPVPVWPEALSSENGQVLTNKDFSFQFLGEELRDARPAKDRVWLVLDFDTDPDGRPNRSSFMLRAVYGEGRHLIVTRKFSGITLLLYGRDAGSSLPRLSNTPM